MNYFTLYDSDGKTIGTLQTTASQYSIEKAINRVIQNTIFCDDVELMLELDRQKIQYERIEIQRILF